MGLCGGFLGWEAYDDRLVDYAKAIEEVGMKIDVEIRDIKAEHPNSYKITLKNEEETHELMAVSTGGGMIEIVEIDGLRVSMVGDYFETLIFMDQEQALEFLRENFATHDISFHSGEITSFIEIKSGEPLNREILEKLRLNFKILGIKKLKPILPVLSRKGIRVPFTNYEEMIKYNEEKNLELWELAIHYESVRGNISTEEVFNKMRNIVNIMKESICRGIKGTDFQDRILGYQSGNFLLHMEHGNLLDAGILNLIIAYTTAMMEIKSSMGVIVAAPTAGACGTLPGSILGTAEAMRLSEDDIIKSLFAASMIGIFLAFNSTFSAEIGGCQAECGSASGMAAAGLVTLKKGNLKQTIDAASIALQNTFGMVCDPVANRVEVPCLGKNIMAASNALSCANMVLAGFDVVIPIGEVIDAMDKVGRSIPYELRCTALGGLSITNTSKLLEDKLSGN